MRGSRTQAGDRIRKWEDLSLDSCRELKKLEDEIQRLTAINLDNGKYERPLCETCSGCDCQNPKDDSRNEGLILKRAREAGLCACGQCPQCGRV